MSCTGSPDSIWEHIVTIRAPVGANKVNTHVGAHPCYYMCYCYLSSITKFCIVSPSCHGLSSCHNSHVHRIARYLSPRSWARSNNPKRAMNISARIKLVLTHRWTWDPVSSSPRMMTMPSYLTTQFELWGWWLYNAVFNAVLFSSLNSELIKTKQKNQHNIRANITL